MTDFVKGTFDEFSFKVHGQKHTFQAPSRAERDAWLLAIETKSQEAKAAHEGIVGSEGYKSQHEKFGKRLLSVNSVPFLLTTLSTAKPSGTAAAATTKSRSRSRPNKMTDSKSKEAVTTGTGVGSTTTAVAAGGEEPARSGSSSDEAKPKSKTRSQSGKRSSIFGTLRAKKEEHDEKKEIKKEDKVEEKAVIHDAKKEEKVEKKAEKEEIKAEEKETKKGQTTAEPFDAAAVGMHPDIYRSHI